MTHTIHGFQLLASFPLLAASFLTKIRTMQWTLVLMQPLTGTVTPLRASELHHDWH